MPIIRITLVLLTSCCMYIKMIDCVLQVVLSLMEHNSTWLGNWQVTHTFPTPPQFFSFFISGIWSPECLAWGSGLDNEQHASCSMEHLSQNAVISVNGRRAPPQAITLGKTVLCFLRACFWNKYKKFSDAGWNSDVGRDDKQFFLLDLIELKYM